MSVLGAVTGTTISLLIVYFLREEGIVPSLICGGAISMIASWWYSRKISIHRPAMTAFQMAHEVTALLKLGFAFMISGLMITGASYAVRIFILRKLGFEAAGLYQSAWNLGSMYVGVIIGAMGADFYPRLTAAAKNSAISNRLVNEQTQVGVLLAGPGVIGTVTLAPWVIMVFYSPQFGQAVEVLRWLCLGVALRVISWPMGYLVIASGRQDLFFLSELTWAPVYIALAWLCITAFGLNGAGIAFFGSYIFHLVVTYTIVRGLSGFRLSLASSRSCLTFVSAVGLPFIGYFILPSRFATVLGLIALLASSVYSVRTLAKLVTVPVSLSRVLKRLRLIEVAR
jgi:PST family polysaccharide transporter